MGKRHADLIEESFMKVALAGGKYEKELGRPAINIKEFSDWIISLREHQVQFYLRTLLLQRKAFCGHGMNFGKELYRCSDEWVPRGWVSDFIYHSRNHHPFLQLFFADPLHPLTKFEKFIVFCIPFITTLAGTGIVIHTGSEGTARYIEIFCYSTLPAFAVLKPTFFLLACPCLHRHDVERSDTTKQVVEYLELIGTGAVGIATTMAMGFTGYAIWQFTTSDDPVGFVILWLFSLFVFAMMWFFAKAVTDFNASRCFLRWTRCARFLLSVMSLGMLRIGSWRTEKDHVLAIINSKIEKDGPEELLRSKDELEVLESATENYRNRIRPPFVVPVFDATNLAQERKEDDAMRRKRERNEAITSKARAAAEKKIRRKEAATRMVESSAVADRERNRENWSSFE